MDNTLAPTLGWLSPRPSAREGKLEPAWSVGDWDIQVLVVVRDASARSHIARILSEEGFRAIEDEDGNVVSTLLECSMPYPRAFPFHLVILESHLSQRNGLELCQLLRTQGIFVPVLVLHEADRQGDRVLGLERGADVCLSKPFDCHELAALCRSLLRRFLGCWSQFSVLQFEELTVDVWEHRVWLRDREVQLSPQEFRLLGLFMKSPGRTWTREELLDRVWKRSVQRSTKTVDVHVSQLRKKIEPDPKRPQYISTVPGRGYQFG
ncbi:response regulator transcription factor [Baaleninema simplex]|uniref:response regulator transcription factor n=1 Tax=Baaleninema simplex TaxID=2862350 RepID=UPI0003462A4F|nr:response regulator transcription factor [Baaleninema simplex]